MPDCVKCFVLEVVDTGEPVVAKMPWAHHFSDIYTNFISPLVQKEQHQNEQQQIPSKLTYFISLPVLQHNMLVLHQIWTKLA